MGNAKDPTVRSAMVGDDLPPGKDTAEVVQGAAGGPRIHGQLPAGRPHDHVHPVLQRPGAAARGLPERRLDPGLQGHRRWMLDVPFYGPTIDPENNSNWPQLDEPRGEPGDRGGPAGRGSPRSAPRHGVRWIAWSAPRPLRSRGSGRTSPLIQSEERRRCGEPQQRVLGPRLHLVEVEARRGNEGARQRGSGDWTAGPPLMVTQMLRYIVRRVLWVDPAAGPG